MSVAATMAASVAVGVGVALARAERDRRGARERSTRGRRFGLWPEERVAEGLRRMALEQLDLAIVLLEGDRDGALAENAVHETRKSLKRLRALIRLLAGELGEEEAAHENAVLRDAGRRLAATRDAEVLVATLDDLLERNPQVLARRPGVVALRARLAAERETIADAASGDAATRAQVLAELRAARGRISESDLPDRDAIETVEPGLSRIYRQGRRRHRRAARGKGDRARLMHMWRKRVKDLRYAAEMLDRCDPAAARGSGRRTRAGRWTKPRQRRREDEAIPRTARRADEIGELLGDEHDLVLLATRIVAESERRGAEGRAEQPDAPNSDGRGAGDASSNPVHAPGESAVSGDAQREDTDVAGVGVGHPDVTAARADGAQDASAPPAATGVASARADDGKARVPDGMATDAEGSGRTPEAGGQDAEATGAEGAGSIGDDTRSILLKLIERRRRRLRREALRQGRRLYRRRPKAFVARTRDAYERAAHRPGRLRRRASQK